LQGWITQQKLPAQLKAQLELLRETADVLVMNKDFFVEANFRAEVCPSLSAVQLFHILSAYQPDECASFSRVPFGFRPDTVCSFDSELVHPSTLEVFQFLAQMEQKVRALKLLEMYTRVALSATESRGERAADPVAVHERGLRSLTAGPREPAPVHGPVPAAAGLGGAAGIPRVPHAALPGVQCCCACGALPLTLLFLCCGCR
jgi:hypothetical protein